MSKKQEYNRRYSKYFSILSSKYLEWKLPRRSNTMLKRSIRVHDCMTYWEWDLYRKNKILDLQMTNRCMDSRFCPNCRRLSLASAIHNLKPTFNTLLAGGYYPFLLTLTVPNCDGEDLSNTITKLYKSFIKFYHLFSKDDRHAFKKRYLKFDACLKVLEITCNSSSKTYHPHLHCMLFSSTYDQSVFRKHIKGEYSNKRKSFNYYSDFDMQIRKLWTMCYDNVSCTSKHYDEQIETYLCDIKEMNNKGIYEVLKYVFKDSDIKNYTDFENIFLALEGRRIRQGYGLLYNVKVDGEEADGEKIDLFLEQKENPERIVTREINSLIKDYNKYRKVSRFKAYTELENIK